MKKLTFHLQCFTGFVRRKCRCSKTSMKRRTVISWHLWDLRGGHLGFVFHCVPLQFAQREPDLIGIALRARSAIQYNQMSYMFYLLNCNTPEFVRFDQYLLLMLILLVALIRFKATWVFLQLSSRVPSHSIQAAEPEIFGAPLCQPSFSSLCHLLCPLLWIIYDLFVIFFVLFFGLFMMIANLKQGGTDRTGRYGGEHQPAWRFQGLISLISFIAIFMILWYRAHDMLSIICFRTPERSAQGRRRRICEDKRSSTDLSEICRHQNLFKLQKQLQICLRLGQKKLPPKVLSSPVPVMKQIIAQHFCTFVTISKPYICTINKYTW